MNKSNLMAKIIIVTLLSISILMPTVVFAATAKDAVCDGAGLIVGSDGCKPPDGSPEAQSVISKGLNLFSVIIGIIAVVMIMIGGLKYMTSQGDATQTNNAKNTVLYAAIGLVIAVLAQIIVQFVIKRFT